MLDGELKEFRISGWKLCVMNFELRPANQVLVNYELRFDPDQIRLLDTSPSRGVILVARGVA